MYATNTGPRDGYFPVRIGSLASPISIGLSAARDQSIVICNRVPPIGVLGACISAWEMPLVSPFREYPSAHVRPLSSFPQCDLGPLALCDVQTGAAIAGKSAHVIVHRLAADRIVAMVPTQ